MNINNYKYGIFIDDNGITGIHNYYERLDDAKCDLKQIMSEITLKTTVFPIGIRLYIFEILSGITFTEIKFKD